MKTCLPSRETKLMLEIPIGVSWALCLLAVIPHRPHPQWVCAAASPLETWGPRESDANMKLGLPALPIVMNWLNLF